MSPGVSAGPESESVRISNSKADIEAADTNEETDLKLLLEQLNYCIALAKRLSDTALTLTTKP